MIDWIEIARKAPDTDLTLWMLSNKACGNCRISKDEAVKYSRFNTYEELEDYAIEEYYCY